MKKYNLGQKNRLPRKELLIKKTITSAKKNDTKTQEQSVEINKKIVQKRLVRKTKSVSVPITPVQEQLAQRSAKEKAKNY